MVTHYFCRDEERREIARSANRDSAGTTFNGIDYVEVLDFDAPDGINRQRTIFVHFLGPLSDAVDPKDVEITGGSRVTGVQVQWTALNTTVDAGLVEAAEQTLFESVDNNVLIVRTDRYGDHSAYTLEIKGLNPPAFDPVLTRVDFSFKAECPHEFDCAPDTECPTETVVEPPIDYLARDFAGFRRIMLDRTSVVMPGWKDRGQVPDVQVALVEAMAYVGDRLSYYQDAVATEAYIGSALQRPSLRRHGRLLDYRLHEGTNARAWVHVDVSGGAPIFIAPRSQFFTKLPATSTVVPHRDVPAGNPHPYEQALTLNPVVFEAMEGLVAFQSHNGISLYTWGDQQCCLQAGATRATLKDGAAGAARLKLMVGDVIIFEQVVDPVTGADADADPDARHAVVLTKVTPAATSDTSNQAEPDRVPAAVVTDHLPIGGVQQPIVEIEWDERDALPFPLCISGEINGQLREDLALVRANVLLADHGRTLIAEAEELVVTAKDRPYRPTLRGTDITYAAAVPTERLSAAESTAQDPAGALPVIKLRQDDGRVWEPVLDLLNSDRFARDFVVEPQNDRRAVLRFGDGTKGVRPVPTTVLHAEYRVGNGALGNVGREAIEHVVAVDEDAHVLIADRIEAVRNPLAAVGGTDPEDANHVRLYAPEAFRSQERAVTEADYAEVSERRRDIQKAAGTRRWTGSWHTMSVTVDRYRGLDVDEPFEAELVRYLDRYRLAGQDVEIDGPRFVPLEIAITVCAEADYFRTDVKQAVLEALSCRDFPDGTRGYFHPDNFTFNDTLYLSSLVAASMEVHGVNWVDVTIFQRWGKEPDDELAKAKIEFGRLEIPQLDDDPNAPENGRLIVTMEGGR